VTIISTVHFFYPITHVIPMTYSPEKPALIFVQDSIQGLHDTRSRNVRRFYEANFWRPFLDWMSYALQRIDDKVHTGIYL